MNMLYYGTCSEDICGSFRHPPFFSPNTQQLSYHDVVVC
jgi:hypothetical protein